MNTPDKNWLSKASRDLERRLANWNDLSGRQIMFMLVDVIEELKATRAKLEELEQTKADKEVH